MWLTYYLLLIRKTIECILCGEEDCWRALVGKYLRKYGDLLPRLTVDLTLKLYHHWESYETLDKTERFYIYPMFEKPKPDRGMAFKSDHPESRYKLCFVT